MPYILNSADGNFDEYTEEVLSQMVKYEDDYGILYLYHNGTTINYYYEYTYSQIYDGILMNSNQRLYETNWSNDGLKGEGEFKKDFVTGIFAVKLPDNPEFYYNNFQVNNVINQSPETIYITSDNGHSIPIDSGIWILSIAGLVFGTYILTKKS